LGDIGVVGLYDATSGGRSAVDRKVGKNSNGFKERGMNKKLCQMPEISREEENKTPKIRRRSMSMQKNVEK